jgi:multidrug efflux pump subunit AcrA (membrane-fusion protein)
LLLIAGLTLAACASVGEEEEEIADPATVEEVDGSDVPRLTLTAEAVERLDIQEATVTDAGSKTVVPYAAIFYTADGATWAYANPDPLTYMRVPIVVDRIQGDRAYLSDGPSSGTDVVTQGLAELYGTETGVEE